MMYNGPFGFAATAKLYDSWIANDLFGNVIYGGWNVGKSSYCLQVLMDKFGDPKGNHLDDYKHFMVFKPEHFVSLNAYLLMKGMKAELEIWDDAGLWLFALDWADPRVKGAIKFLNVAKTTTGGLFLTTPTPEMILKKALMIEGIHISKVVRLTGNIHQKTLRRVKTYRNNILVQGKRNIKQILEDDFNAMLPDHVWEWYDPLRRSYAKEAIMILIKAYGLDIDIDSANSVSEMFGKLNLAMTMKTLENPVAPPVRMDIRGKVRRAVERP